jgi:phage repressor protein C with HTH and peptisase S24 domain
VPPIKVHQNQHDSDTFTRFLHRVFDATNLTNPAELANTLDIHRSAISQARRKGSIPASWLLALLGQFGLNPDWLENGREPVYLYPKQENDAAFFPVPKVKARLCAGSGSFEISSEIDGYYSFQKSWLKGKGVAAQMVLMDIFGNSMSPEIKDGDTVLIDQSMKEILAGAIYAVGIEDTIMVKRIERRPAKLVLISDNKEYEPIYLKDEEINSIRIIGKVLWICRELR